MVFTLLLLFLLADIGVSVSRLLPRLAGHPIQGQTECEESSHLKTPGESGAYILKAKKFTEPSFQ